MRELGLLPWEFERLTPAEFWLLAEGHRQRREERMQLLAWAMTKVIGMWSKKRVQYHELLAELLPEERVGQMLREQMRRGRRDG